MATLDVARIVTRWMNYVATDANMFDKIEMMYSDMYAETNITDILTDKCCVPCSCDPGECVISPSDQDKDGTSILRNYKLKCGCNELCYTFNGNKVGRSQKTQCDGSVTHNEYR